MNEDKDDTIYIRRYAFGQKQQYDENQKISMKKKVIYSFVGKNGESVEKVVDFDEERVYPLLGILVPINIYMRLEYPDYKGDDLVEGLEISSDETTTHVHGYRSFSLSNKIVIGNQTAFNFSGVNFTFNNY